MMSVIKGVLTFIFLHQTFASERTIIVNEETLMGSCVGTCDSIGGPINQNPAMLNNPYNCQTVKNCRRNSKGWEKGFVRCDFCECTCVDNRPSRDIEVVNKNKWFTEPALYGTCRTKCPKSGLVRTDMTYGDETCQEVRDCRHARNGWTRGFVRCDYCQCDCINRKYAQSYRLENVVYTLDESAIEIDKPIALKQTFIENDSGMVQEAERLITFTYAKSISVELAKSISSGLEITTTAGVGVGDFSVQLSTTLTLNMGFTSTTGTVETTSVEDSIKAKVKVPPGMFCEVKVVGHSMKIDVPYTATLITTYEQGDPKRERVTGMFVGVELNQFRVQYGEFLPLSQLPNVF